MKKYHIYYYANMNIQNTYIFYFIRLYKKTIMKIYVRTSSVQTDIAKSWKLSHETKCNRYPIKRYWRKTNMDVYVKNIYLLIYLKWKKYICFIRFVFIDTDVDDEFFFKLLYFDYTVKIIYVSIIIKRSNISWSIELQLVFAIKQPSGFQLDAMTAKHN